MAFPDWLRDRSGPLVIGPAIICEGKTNTGEPWNKPWPYYFPLYWRFNRDSYNWDLINPYNKGEYNPVYNLNNQSCFHCSGDFCWKVSQKKTFQSPRFSDYLGLPDVSSPSASLLAGHCKITWITQASWWFQPTWKMWDEFESFPQVASNKTT